MSIDVYLIKIVYVYNYVKSVSYNSVFMPVCSIW